MKEQAESPDAGEPKAASTVYVAQSDSRRDWSVACLLLAVGAIAYALFVVQDYSGPLIGGKDYDDSYRGDANYFEFLGYYVRDHYHFGPVPIQFSTTDVAYPEGTHIGLLSWCAERDLFHAAMLKIWGAGPWLQVYITLGAWVGAVGVTAILRRAFGILRASVVGFAASFMAFYAWYKFPYHLNCSAIHWVIISISLDAVMMRTAVRGERLTFGHIGLRAGLLVLSLGLDLGYIAGHALTSCCITSYCIWSKLGRRDSRLLRRFQLILPFDFRLALRAERPALLAALAMLCVGTLLYLPFVAAVVRDAGTYPMTEPNGNFWASQLHAFFPYLPGIHPNSQIVRSLFGHDEGVGEYAPGFALIGAAAVGIWVARKNRAGAVYKPLLITALLVFVFHPRWCKSLQIFPWFAYYRVAGRGTVVLPVLLALIGASADGWPRRAKYIVGLVAALEFATATLLVSEYKPSRLGKAELTYFRAIARTPGRGLLEWPFCIASANITITRELCPYAQRNYTAYAYRRFHEKSTISIYLSRVHPTQFQHWLDDGWDTMFMPNDVKREHPTQELRCFSDSQWERFDKLYYGHDFAGIQLYADVLPLDCVDMFHKRYGLPAATATLPRLGAVEFIPFKLRGANVQ